MKAQLREYDQLPEQTEGEGDCEMSEQENSPIAELQMSVYSEGFKKEIIIVVVVVAIICDIRPGLKSNQV